MNSFPTYKIIVTEYFKKQLKRLLKKNRSLQQVFLTPICIYSKNEKENLTYNELSWHLEKTKEELKELL